MHECIHHPLDLGSKKLVAAGGSQAAVAVAMGSAGTKLAICNNIHQHHDIILVTCNFSTT
jgi:hypothetical protein